MRSDWPGSPRPSKNGGPGRTAHGQKRREGGDNEDHRQADAHAGEGQGAYRVHRLHVADVDPVYQVVEHVDDLGENGGQSQGKHQLANIAAAQIHGFLIH